MYEFEHDYDPKQRMSDPDPQVRAIEQAFRVAAVSTSIGGTLISNHMMKEMVPYASLEEYRPVTSGPRPDDWRNLPA